MQAKQYGRRHDGAKKLHAKMTRVVTWNPESNWHDNFSLAPKRRQGRPLTRWDGKLRTFCRVEFPDTQCWMYVAASSAWKRNDAKQMISSTSLSKLYSDESA